MKKAILQLHRGKTMIDKILVVDDSKSIRTMAVRALQAKGYEVTEACDGEEGLKRFESEKFDLVISDLHMPKKDGIEMVGAMLNLPDRNETPIIMLTSETSLDTIKKTKTMGDRIYWLYKPLDPEKLINIVHHLEKQLEENTL